jgi:hypothetical protein
MGRLTAGSVQRTGPDQIRLYDEHDAPPEYFSGDALRSWCVVDAHGKPLADWYSVRPEDVERLLAFAMDR